MLDAGCWMLDANPALIAIKLSVMKKNLSWVIFFPLLFCLSFCNNSDTGKTAQTETQQPPELKSIFINGDSLHYVDMGKGEPVVFVHGAVGDYRTYSRQMDEFAK